MKLLKYSLEEKKMSYLGFLFLCRDFVWFFPILHFKVHGAGTVPHQGPLLCQVQLQTKANWGQYSIIWSKVIRKWAFIWRLLVLACVWRQSWLERNTGPFCIYRHQIFGVQKLAVTYWVFLSEYIPKTASAPSLRCIFCPVKHQKTLSI